MTSDAPHKTLATAIAQLKSAFESELRIIAGAQEHLEVLAVTDDQRRRDEASAVLRDQLRLLGRTNAAIRDFLNAAAEATRMKNG